jgi:hypothetical protein
MAQRATARGMKNRLCRRIEALQHRFRDKGVPKQRPTLQLLEAHFSIEGIICPPCEGGLQGGNLGAGSFRGLFSIRFLWICDIHRELSPAT